MSISMNVFTQDAFSAISLLTAVEKVPFQPRFLSGMDLFGDEPILTEDFFVEERSGVLTLIQSSPRNAPLAQRTTEQRKGRSFKTLRIAKQDHMTAAQIQGVRAFGSLTELQVLQNEIMRRLSGPTGIMRDVEYTWENLALGAVQGILLDADGSTISNLYTEFGVSQPAEIAFDLTGARAYSTTTAIGVLRAYIQSQVVRPMLRAAQGAAIPGTEVVALCGDNFYDDISNHGEVRTTYLAQIQAQELRAGTAFESFSYGGVTWVNYRGSDDASTVGINTDKAKFFLRGAPGLFKRALAPAEFFNFANTPGRPLYPLIVPDPSIRQAFVDIEIYSYPFYICTRPLTLYRGKRGS